MPTRDLSTSGPNPALSHPVWWMALALLVMNDHVLKGSDLVPAAVTGKLSDFAGLVVAPPLLASLLGNRRAAARLGFALVGGGFVLVKLCPQLADLLGAALSAAGVPSRVWADPSDLVALTSLLVAWRVMQRRRPVERRRARAFASPLLARAGVVLASIACLATSKSAPRSANDVQREAPDRVYVLWGSIRAIDPASGRELGRIALPRTYPEPAWLAAGSALYVADGQSGVRAFDAASLQPLFTTAIDCAGCRMRLAACGDHLFVLMVHPGNTGSPRSSGWVFSLDRASGELSRIWRFEPLSGFDHGDHDAPVCHGESLLLPAPLALLRYESELPSPVVVSRQRAPVWLQVVGDALYSASADRGLVELSLSSGAEIWRRPIEFEAGAPAFNATQETLVFTGGENLIAVDRRSKVELWRKQGSFVLLRGASVLIRTDARGQRVEVLDIRTGGVLWRLPDGPHGDLFAADGLLLSRSHESVEAFDAKSGARRWTHSLGAR